VKALDYIQVFFLSFSLQTPPLIFGFLKITRFQFKISFMKKVHFLHLAILFALSVSTCEVSQANHIRKAPAPTSQEAIVSPATDVP
jgi:hypothetical protein